MWSFQLDICWGGGDQSEDGLKLVTQILSFSWSIWVKLTTNRQWSYSLTLLSLCLHVYRKKVGVTIFQTAGENVIYIAQWLALPVCLALRYTMRFSRHIRFTHVHDVHKNDQMSTICLIYDLGSQLGKWHEHTCAALNTIESLSKHSLYFVLRYLRIGEVEM